MTAEIAILNKTAVVLAADSAVTIGSGGAAKIFNTANKIFEISSSSPIGLMIFNRLDYMDLPLEVLAKEFRRSRKAATFKTVKDCQEDFFNFLRDEIEYSEADEFHNFTIVARTAVHAVADQWSERLNQHILETQKVLVSKFNGILKSVLEEGIGILEGLERAHGFGKVVLSAQQKAGLDRLCQDAFTNMQLTATCRKLMYKFVCLYISQNALSPVHTGLVFAGFGEDEMCPSLIHSDSDGILDKKLKLADRDMVDIGRNGPAAEVLGFAQDDMVQSFVNGIDPVIRGYSEKLTREAVEAAARLVLQPLVNDDKKLQEVIAGLSGDFDNLSRDLKGRADDFVATRFTQEVKDMVRSMPKEEMATLAESLIEITSLKRKVTRERETVGGEVDVAVISRAEGLIWVKRKHYFPPELNSRFFKRSSGG